MDTQKNNNITLDLIPANRRVIEELSSHNLISADAREYGLRLLYPSQNWGLWVSRMLLVLSVSLILSGIVYFFAFNWTKITPEIKLSSIQISILGCLGASYFYGLQRLSGKILLLSSSVLVGVFLAVFGQIYQTGADAYNLFMMWALLTLPWVIISEFAALWVVWLVISNTFLVLYWTQAALPERETEMMIVSYLAVFNGLFLGLREYFLTKGVHWLEEQWTRVVLVVPILVYALIPTIALIVEPSSATHSIVLGTLLSAVIHAVFYIVYRFKLPDMWGLAATILSGCIILESAIFKALTEVFRHSDAIMYLLMGGITLGVFTLAIIKLRVIAKEMEKKMSKYMTNITAKGLLGSWLNAGLVPQSESGQLEGFIVSQQQEKELPLYLRILVGIGAFIASLCFIGFLSVSKIINFNSEGGLIFWGLIFVGAALFLAKTSGDKDNTVKHSFLIQTSFCTMGVGKILFVMGFAEMFGRDGGWGVTLSTLLITAATYHVYRMSIDRFLSTLAIFTSLLINIVSQRYFGTSTEIVLNLFFLIQIIIAAVLLTSGRVKRDYIPLAYATAFSLCITVIYFAVESKIGHWGNEQVYSLTFINALLTLSLVGLIGWASGNLEKLKTEPLMLASLGAILLGIVSAPGVILSICLMVLGYAKHEKLLLLTGILLMPIFIFLYYYNLDVSLMAKSGVLVGSGVVLLVGRGYLAVKQLDREV